MRQVLRRAFVVVTLTVLLAAPQAWAWGNTGHEAVAYMAWQQMTPATRLRAIALIKLVPTLTHTNAQGVVATIPGYADWVKELPAGLSADDTNLYLFMRAATWPDSIKHQWLHDSDNPPAHLIGPDSNIGFTDTASHGYWHFVNKDFAADNSAVPATPVPNAATQIVQFRTAIASSEPDVLKAYDLCWLEHMLGDIHQPLHAAARVVADKDDEGGNNVLIKLPPGMAKEFRGADAKADAPTELHGFWDDLPGQGNATEIAEAATFGATLTPASGAAIADVDPNDWAAESFAMAQADAYVTPIGPALGPYTVTEAYRTQALKDAQLRIALAGARLANLLNENLK